MTVKIDSFLSKYTGGFIPQETFIDILKKQMDGEKYYDLSDEDYGETIRNYNEYQLRESEWAEVISYQNQGKTYEKQQLLEQAADSYEKAIVIGESSPRIIINNYFHSIERLAVVYRKLKRYDEEIRVVSIGLQHQHEGFADSYFEKLRKRLSKAESLLK